MTDEASGRLALTSEYRLSKTAFVMIDGEPHNFVPQSAIPDRIMLLHAKTGAPFLFPDETGAIGVLTRWGWDELLIAGRLRVVEPPSRITARLIARMAEWDSRDILGNPGGVQRPGEALPLDPAAAKMLAQVLLLDEHGASKGRVGITRALDRHWVGEFVERFGPHDPPETVRRWYRERGVAGDRRLQDFVRMWGRVPRGAFKNGPSHEIMQVHCLRDRTEPGSVTELADQIRTAIEKVNAGEHEHYEKPEEPYPVPHYSSIYRAKRELDNAYTVAAEHGDAVMRADHRGAGRPLIANRPLEIGIIDHTRIPVAAVVDLDHDIVMTDVWLSVLIDVHTRVILAWVVTAFAPSFWTVCELIRRANLPKRPPPEMAKRYPGLRRLCGRSAQLVVDNANEFRGHGFENAAASAGFAVRFAPVRRPTYKSVGERFFLTIKKKLTRRLPGRMIPIADARLSEYDPTIDAVATLDDLEALTNQCIAEYHTEPHRGIKKRQPALLFHKATGGFIDIAHDLGGFFNEVLDIMPKGIQVESTGAEAFGMRYFHTQNVARLLDDHAPTDPIRGRPDNRTTRTKCKYDPMNIGRIKVWNRKTRKYLDLICEDPTYAEGMPLKLHEQIVEQARREGAAFNTPEERAAARTSRIEAIRRLDAVTRAEAEDQFAKLKEIPRLNQITGNIVEKALVPPSAITIGDFIAHDDAALTSLDEEILSPRKPFTEEGTPRRKRVHARDRRDAGQPRKTTPKKDSTKTNPAKTRRAGGSRRVDGDYKG